MKTQIAEAVEAAIRGAGGGKDKPRTPIEAPDSLRSTAYARILDLVSEGEIVGFADAANPLSCVYLNETPVANGDGTLNFRNIQVDSRVGTQTQDYIRGFEGVENELAIGTPLVQETPWVRNITNLNLNAVRVRISTPTLTKANTTNGDINGFSVSYKIELAVDSGPYVQKLAGAFTGKTTTKYERTHNIELPPATTNWTIRVTRLTPNSNTSAIQSTTIIESFAEIIYAKLRMPMSAIISIIVDAEQFNNIPSRAYDLKGRIVRVPSNYNAFTRAYTGVWDGTFQLAWTDNPAWIFYDMGLSRRYGLGRYVSEALMDKWALYDIAKYCDALVDDGFGGQEPRFTCNVYFQRQEDALKVMQDLATCFRGIIYANGGAVTAVADMPQDAIYTYTPSNVIDGKFVYAGSARKVRHTVALVSWMDMADFGRAKIEYVEDKDGILRYGVQPTEVVAIGCTSRGQARRLGRYILTTERYETDSVVFSVGLDGTIVAPGSIIEIADPLRAGRRMGGRLSNVTANSIVVDQLPEVVPVAGDTVITHGANGKSQRNIIQSVTAGTKTIVMTANFASAPVISSVWAIESPTLKTQKFRVLGVAELSDQLGYAINAIEHVSGKFAFVEDGLLIEPTPISSMPGKVIFAPATVSMSQRDVADENTSKKIVTISWSPVANADRYELEYRYENASWILMPTVTAPLLDLPDLLPGVFEVRVTAINSMGTRSQATYAGPYDITPNIKPPGFVAQLDLDISQALTTAQNAQAAADGVIDTFWQNDPPTIGGSGGAKVGDVWYDTNDGNKIYRVVGTSWVYSPDDRIAQAIASAATAQSTADGKVKMFVGATAPVSGMQLNDLWHDTTTASTKRWNGASWITVADVTLDQLSGSGVNLLPDTYSTYEATALPPIQNPSGASLGRDGTNFKVVAGLYIASAAALNLWLGSTQNIPHTTGRKYLVSAWVLSGTANAQCQFFFEGTTGSYAYGTVHTLGAANNWQRVSAILDASAVTGIRGWLGFTKFGAASFIVDGIMLEELIGRANNPSAYVRGTSVGQAISALLAAQTAQATADGNIDIFKQSAPPAIGGVGAKVGDYWQDSDDNKWYYCNGTSWVESTDIRLPQVITDLQSTNGVVAVKTRLFYQEAQPTATANGDIWYQESSKLTRYWNGAAWSLLADQTSAASDSLVLNPNFEMGLTHWIVDNTFYIEASTNAALVGNGLVKGPGTGVRQAAGSQFPVTPFSRVLVSVAMRNIAGTATGTSSLVVFFYNSDGTYQTTKIAGYYTDGRALNATEWKQVSAKVMVPRNAAFARVGVEVVSHGAGFWAYDNVRAAYVDDAITAPFNSSNVIPNGNFQSNEGAFPEAFVMPKLHEFVMDSWKVGVASGYFATAGTLVGIDNFSSQRVIGILDQGGTLVPGYSSCYVLSDKRIDVKPGEVYVLDTSYRRDLANGIPAGVSAVVYMGFWGYPKDSATAAWFGGTADSNPASDQRTSNNVTVTIPANIVAIVPLIGMDFVNSTGANVTMPYATMHIRFRSFSARRQSTMDDSVVVHGTTYGKPANVDLYDESGIRRVGLRVRGSRQILGGARNIRAAQVMGFNAVRTATACTANSSGQVSINAHSVDISGETVTYNAVTNAIVGLSQSLTYVIYTLDPFLDGGTRTYYAQSTVLSAQQAGEGAVHIGNVTIPTSGSSSGGSSGGGNPGEWCVEADMVLPDGRLARDIQAGDYIPCWNYDAYNPAIVMVRVESNEVVEDQPCSYIVTDHFASVIASNSTPMSLRDGRTVKFPQMRGEEALVNRRGQLKWEHVREVGHAGQRAVAKIKVHQHCYFAGMYDEVTIATHNPNQKP